ILSSSWSSKVTCLDDLSYFQEQKENYKLLQEILELPPKYKLPIYLFYYEGYSTEEISKILDMNSSTVRSNLHRGRKLLKNLLESGDRIE
ncbi:RNA polymerase sigma factor, partial [Clostridium sp.]|uniref:RNA polymerase sigma factor n=1 Tax=Clostridium sp. TaxID=1506 RepID=UPI003F40233F